MNKKTIVLISVLIMIFNFTSIPFSFAQNNQSNEDMYKIIQNRLDNIDEKIIENIKSISEFQEVNIENREKELESINKRFDIIESFQNNTADVVWGSANLNNLITIGLVLVAITITVVISARPVKKEIGTSMKYLLQWIPVGIIIGMLIFLIIDNVLS